MSIRRSQSAQMLSHMGHRTHQHNERGVSGYTIHLTEAERIALRMMDGGVLTEPIETRARIKAEVNARLRPRRFSWETEQ